jgi:hypothetical protein
MSSDEQNLPMTVPMLKPANRMSQEKNEHISYFPLGELTVILYRAIPTKRSATKIRMSGNIDCSNQANGWPNGLTLIAPFRADVIVRSDIRIIPMYAMKLFSNRAHIAVPLNRKRMLTRIRSVPANRDAQKFVKLA